MLHNGKKQKLEWAVALMNGTGVKSSLSGDVVVDPATGEGEIASGKFGNTPDLLNPVVVARVGYNHAGIKGYDEVDRSGGGFRFRFERLPLREPAFAAAAALALAFGGSVTAVCSAPASNSENAVATSHPLAFTKTSHAAPL